MNTVPEFVALERLNYITGREAADKESAAILDGEEVNDFAIKYGITLVQGDLIGARWVANQIAIERAVEKTKAKHVITFHSRVSSAKEFSSDSSHGIKQFLPEFSIYHVNGAQHSSERKQLIRDFREAKKSLITNARCLTEGIDVPAVDMVAFIDPRHSKIDIAQATGRAIRKPRGSDKTLGYIVVPLFLEQKGEETLEQALKRSDFSDVADVLNALQEQDEDLIAIIRELQNAKGRGEVFNPRRLAEKVDVFGPTIDLSRLTSNIFAEIVDRTGVSWDDMFGRLLLFRDKHQHCRVPHHYADKSLAKWVSHQRSFARNGTLSSSRKQRLDNIGFEWAPYEMDWEEGFRHLKSYQERCGHCRVPLDHKEDGFQLGAWTHSQRQTKKSMSNSRRQRLDQLGFVWGLYETDWEMGFNCLKAYKERNGHCRVPVSHKEKGFNLGLWVSNQRRLKSQIAVERRQRLDALGFIWDVNEADWETGYRLLNRYKERMGHCLVPQKSTENGFRLGLWVNVQRREHDSTTEQRRQKLDELGFVWDVLSERCEEGFRHLKKYKEHLGHCRVPVGYILDGFPLGTWARTQRRDEDALFGERRERLDELGFVWDPMESDWEEGLRYLKSYKHREGHCRVPTKHDENGFRLGQWVGNRRANRDTLSGEKRRQLDELGFDWDPLQSDWEEGYSYLKRYKDREGHCRVPLSHEENVFQLGRWACAQRREKDRMADERRRRLDGLGFVWDTAEWDWEEGLSHLRSYKDREGHCRVPNKHKESDFRLGQWVGTQRAKASTLSKERRGRLDALGFVWKVR
jgi:hypothetical protein